jgi:hypothetical protein
MTNTHPALLRKFRTPIDGTFLLGTFRSMTNTNSTTLRMSRTPIDKTIVLGAMFDTNFSILGIVRTSTLILAQSHIGTMFATHSVIQCDVFTSLGRATRRFGAMFHADLSTLGLVRTPMGCAHFDSGAVFDAYATVDYAIGTPCLGADVLVVIFSSCCCFLLCRIG